MPKAKAPKESTEVSTERKQSSENDSINKKNFWGETKLHTATLQGNEDKIMQLLNKGADPEISLGHWYMFHDYKDDKLIHIAIKKGYQDVFNLLLSSVDVNSKGQKGASPLHLAIEAKDTFIFDELLRIGANVNILNNNKQTPLHLAVQHKFEDAVATILAHNANINTQDNKGLTALHLAVQQKNKGMLELLFKYYPDETIKDANGKKALALIKGDNDFLEEYLKLSMAASTQLANNEQLTPKSFFNEVLARQEMNSIHSSNELIAPENNNSEDSKLNLYNLISQTSSGSLITNLCAGGRLNVKSTNNEGLTALHLAALKSQGSVVGALRECGVIMDAKTPYGETALHIATKFGKIAFIKELLKTEVQDYKNLGKRLFTPELLTSEIQDDNNLPVQENLHDRMVDQQNGQGNTALHVAIIAGNLALVEYLLAEVGANPNIANKDLQTPLHLLIAKLGETEDAILLIDILMQQQASLSIKDKQGNTPLHLAFKKGFFKVIEALAKTDIVGAVDSSDRDGNTVLYLAVQKGKKDIVEYLLARGADPLVKNYYGGSAFSISQKPGYKFQDIKKTFANFGLSDEAKKEHVGLPLHEAILNTESSQVAQLIKTKDDLMVKASNGQAPMHLVA